MMMRTIFGSLAIALVLSGNVVQGQVPPVVPAPVVPAPVVQVHYVPITIVVDLDAALGKVLQELNGPPVAPGVVPPGVQPPNFPPPGVQPPNFPPPPVPFPGQQFPAPGVRGIDLRLPPAVVNPAETRRQLFQGKLIQRIRDNRPLQKLAARELEKISQPVSLGNNLWLSLNMKEIVLQEIDVQGLKQAIVRLAVHMEPIIVLSKEPPAPLPLPQFALGKALPLPAPDGTPLNIFLRIDPKAVPEILPPDIQQELAKYGINPATVTFNQQATKDGTRLFVNTPMQKPLAATLQVGFVPVLKDNVLAFAHPDSEILLPANVQADNPLQQALQKATQETIRVVVTSKLKETTVDFTPHLKKLASMPLGQPAAANKVQATIHSIRVEDLGAANNQLLSRISGVVSKEGIVVFAP